MFQIENKDNLCMARALVTAKAHSRRAEHPRDWNNIRRGDEGKRAQQRNLAKELMRESGLENHQGLFLILLFLLFTKLIVVTIFTTSVFLTIKSLQECAAMSSWTK